MDASFETLTAAEQQALDEKLGFIKSDRVIVIADSSAEKAGLTWLNSSSASTRIGVNYRVGNNLLPGDELKRWKYIYLKAKSGEGGWFHLRVDRSGGDVTLYGIEVVQDEYNGFPVADIFEHSSVRSVFPASPSKGVAFDIYGGN
ncbi:hypothetical protein [Pseudomonas aegrilactucae]|uniref:Uncharacterized protein n=1 Tax=Pseudomonas aegrilactucae TaxID=2854028 RepID=A0A9Q2XMM0_9PSED|nr:hypothetical protein [Pseudomonas aegrilactucae]MBV6289074.1 hypothetical protein [Pseudomonas aegrilactucae]